MRLNENEMAALADLGVRPDDSGVLRSADGGQVADGIAVILLKARHPETGQFIAGDHPAAYAAAADFGLPSPTRIDGPDQFDRGLLTAGHEADSPANTGRRAAAPMPKSHVAEPQDFTRGPLLDGHQADPPGSDRSGAEGMPGGTPAADRLAAATGRLAGNYAQGTQERLTTSVLPAHGPAPSRAVMKPDMQAECVPAPASMTMQAPGERRD